MKVGCLKKQVLSKTNTYKRMISGLEEDTKGINVKARL